MNSTYDPSQTDLGEIIAGMNEPYIKQRLIDNTEQSVSRGTFGSPTFYVNDEIFLGKINYQNW